MILTETAKNFLRNYLLLEYDFIIEHQNIYYSKKLYSYDIQTKSDIYFKYGNISKGNEQEIAFYYYNDVQIGGCAVHYLSEYNIAYLRWIYINSDITHKQFGTKCIKLLFSELYKMGFTRIDTDTADNNAIAQSYYLKNGFTDCGKTKSYYKGENI